MCLGGDFQKTGSPTSRREIIASLSGLFLVSHSRKVVAKTYPLHVSSEDVICKLGIDDAGAHYRLATTTGEPILDRQLAAEANRISESLQVRPAILIWPERGSFTAFITKKAVIQQTAATVVFGIDLLRATLSENRRGWGGVTIAGFLAHEFAHMYQWSKGYAERLAKGSAVVRVELHADVMAGWYLGTKRRNGVPMDIGALTDGIYLQGDHLVQDPDHHGTPQQRRKAVIQGYRAGIEGRSGSEAAGMGERYVEHL